MTKARYEIAGRLVTLAPLHVGSGLFDKRATVTGRAPSGGQDGAQHPPQVALIVRDEKKNPYLPSTTLKGLLRRLAEGDAGWSREDVVALFGEIKGEGQEGEGQGRMGALTVRGAVREGTGPDASAAPFTGGNVEPDDLGRGVFVAARTRIDPASGTARDGNLFFQEMVAPGSAFAFRCLVEVRGTDAAAVAELRTRKLLELLRRLTAEDGHAVGKGQADGFGRLRLDPATVRIDRRLLDASGDFTAVDASALWAETAATATDDGSVVLDLVCDGPFAVIDASRKADRKTVNDAPPEKARSKAERRGGVPQLQAQLQAQRLAERLPLILGSSLSGALRARARWLEARDRLRTSKPDKEVDPGGKVVSTAGEIVDLSSVERLFGVTGFRGLVSVARLEVREAEPWAVTSVKLDRFSGAPVDNALFTTATFLGVRISLALRLDRQDAVFEGTKQNILQDADRTLFKALIADIRKHGIELGHGGNKGFGWFTVEGGDNAR